MDHPRPRHHHRPRPLVVALVGLLALAGAGCGSSSHRTATRRPAPHRTATAPAADILSVPVATADTSDGPVTYRSLGTGPPLVLITGFSATIDTWDPTFVDALAAHHRVVVLNNAGVAGTAPRSPLTMTAMADQTSALITALRLGRSDVLGWSMGGMIAQVLAATHPAQVARLVLAATQPGNGHALPVPAAAAAELTSTNPEVVLSALFPADQSVAARNYGLGVLGYGGPLNATESVVAEQALAIGGWLEGNEPAGHRLSALTMPTLVADGEDDALDPVANDHLLATTIPGAQLVLYPDAGHAFLFQDQATFVPRIERFLG